MIGDVKYKLWQNSDKYCLLLNPNLTHFELGTDTIWWNPVSASAKRRSYSSTINYFHCPCFAFIITTGDHAGSPTGNHHSGRTRLLPQPQFSRFAQPGTKSMHAKARKAPRVVRACSSTQTSVSKSVAPLKALQTTPTPTHPPLGTRPEATSPRCSGLPRLRGVPAGR